MRGRKEEEEAGQKRRRRFDDVRLSPRGGEIYFMVVVLLSFLRWCKNGVWKRRRQGSGGEQGNGITLPSFSGRPLAGFPLLEADLVVYYSLPCFYSPPPWIILLPLCSQIVDRWLTKYFSWKKGPIQNVFSRFVNTRKEIVLVFSMFRIKANQRLRSLFCGGVLNLALIVTGLFF